MRDVTRELQETHGITIPDEFQPYYERNLLNRRYQRPVLRRPSPPPDRRRVRFAPGPGPPDDDDGWGDDEDPWGDGGDGGDTSDDWGHLGYLPDRRRDRDDAPFRPRRRAHVGAPAGLVIDGAGRDHMVHLLRRDRYRHMAKSSFPYRPGDYVFEDGGPGEIFEGFIRAAEVADPLAPMTGRKYHIGRHVDIKRDRDEFHIVIHKGVPPKGMKILALKVREHVDIMGGANIELFQKLGVKMKLILSDAQLKDAPPKHLVKVFLQGLKGKANAHFIIFQTGAKGGPLSNKKTWRARGINKTLRQKR